MCKTILSFFGITVKKFNKEKDLIQKLEKIDLYLLSIKMNNNVKF